MRSGKRVITVDLNPMSRTARNATITIVDNVTRAMPLLLERVAAHRSDAAASRGLPDTFDNDRGLRAAEAAIRADRK